MKQALVIGLGVTGKAVAAYLLDQGFKVIGVDKKRMELPELQQKGLQIREEDHPFDLADFDLVVPSPGVAPNHPLIQEASRAGVETVGEIELALRQIKPIAAKGKVLAITGTNGKTTVTLMVEHVLKSAGISAMAVGNVGVPLISQLDQKVDVWVVELSSYQLETITSRVIDAGVILNITPDHLDRYSGMEAYASAKLRMAACIKPGGRLYIEELCKKRYGGEGLSFGYNSDCDLYCDGSHLILKTIEYLLPKEYRARVSHEVENFMACYALCRECGITAEQMTLAVKTFVKPPHRIEYVCSYNGVNYYDDSKGTNVDAVIRAVQALDGDVVLIAGGVDKGSSYVPWIEAFQSRVSQICAIGQAANKIARELGQKMNVEIFSTLDDAVRHAAKVAKPGQNVLLSPGCSSFDMFRDYEHRGEEFRKVVKSLGSKI